MEGDDRPLKRISRKDDVKKGYWVIAYRSISNESALKAYRELALPALQPFGARLLVMRPSKVQPHESGLQQRAVIVEFDSYETALAAYESEAYKKALQALGSGAERDFRIVEGV
jgi:uncharacterized protein (DUF1330 family)